MHSCVHVSFHIHTAILLIIYSKYVHGCTRSVFAQQMPVSGPNDRMDKIKAGTVGTGEALKNNSREKQDACGAGRKEDGWRNGRMRVEERQSAKVNI